MKALSASQKFIQGLILTKFQEDVHVFSILKEVFEAYNMVVVETSMDLNFGHELLLCARLCQGGLRDNLGGRHSLSFKVCEFVALGKTSFAEEFTSEIFLNAYVSIELNDLLFNNNLSVIWLILGGLGSLLRLLHCYFYYIGTSCSRYQYGLCTFLIIRIQIIFKQL